MGYVNYHFRPPHKWFAGRVFLNAARDTVNEYKDIKDAEQKVLNKFYHAKANIIRGIRTIYFLPAEKEDIQYLDDLIYDLKDKIDYNKFQEFKKIIDIKPKVYNRFNEIYLKYDELIDEDQTPNLTKDEIIHKGITERIIILDKLLNNSINIFSDVYYEHCEDAIQSVNYFEGCLYNMQYIYDELVDLNAIDLDYEEFIEKDFDVYDYPELVELGELKNKELYEDGHYEEFWDLEEFDNFKF